MIESTTPSADYDDTRLKLLRDILILVQNSKEFEELTVPLNDLIAEVYTIPTAAAVLEPIVGKFMAFSPSANSNSSSQGASAGSGNSSIGSSSSIPMSPVSLSGAFASASSTSNTLSSRIKLLRFYHQYSAEAFNDFWSSIPHDEGSKHAVLSWLKMMQASRRFRTDIHFSVLFQVLGKVEFGKYLNSPEADSAAFDRVQLVNALVQLSLEVQNKDMLPQLITATVRLLLQMPHLTPELRATLTTAFSRDVLPSTASVVLAPSLTSSSSLSLSSSSTSFTSTTASASAGAPNNTECDNNKFNVCYADARSILLFLGNSDAFADDVTLLFTKPAFANLRVALFQVLLDKAKPAPMIRVLLRARDYTHLYELLRELHKHDLVDASNNIEKTSETLEYVRTNVQFANLVDVNTTTSGVTGQSTVNSFQRELFLEGSFVVQTARFFLFLQEMYAFEYTGDAKLDGMLPPRLMAQVEALFAHVKRLVHDDKMIDAFVRLHIKFTVEHAAAFLNQCSLCAYLTVPYTCSAGSWSSPRSLGIDTITSLLQAPKHYSHVLALMKLVHSLTANIAPFAVRGPVALADLLRILLNCPCKYKEDYSRITRTAQGITRIDSSGIAVDKCMTALTALIPTYGSSFAMLLEECILQCWQYGEIDHSNVRTRNACDSTTVSSNNSTNTGNPTSVDGNSSSNKNSSNNSNKNNNSSNFNSSSSSSGAEASPKISLDQWSKFVNIHVPTQRNLINAVGNAAGGSLHYLVSIPSLQSLFTYQGFTAALPQALLRPKQCRDTFRTILLNLVLRGVQTKYIDAKTILQTLFHEVHDPSQNKFDAYFTADERSLILDYMEKFDPQKDFVRNGLISRDGRCPFPVHNFLKNPRLLDFLTREFNSDAYDAFGAMSHATYFMPLWRELAKTVLSETVFQQAAATFKAVSDECRKRTMNASKRTAFETCVGQYKLLFELYSDTHAAQIKALKTDAKVLLKSKPALVKALNSM